VRIRALNNDHKEELYVFEPKDFLFIVDDIYGSIRSLQHLIRFELSNGGTFCFEQSDGDNIPNALYYHEPVLPPEEPLNENFHLLLKK
jgi:hypothetical protein